MITTLALMIAAALVANNDTREGLALLLADIYAAILGCFFGEGAPLATYWNEIEPSDDLLYADGVYEVSFDGYRRTAWMTGAQVNNALAFGYTVAYEVLLTSNLDVCTLLDAAVANDERTAMTPKTKSAKGALKTYTFYWSPTGQQIGEYQATSKTAAKAMLKADRPEHARFMGEIYSVRS